MPFDVNEMLESYDEAHIAAFVSQCHALSRRSFQLESERTHASAPVIHLDLSPQPVRKLTRELLEEIMRPPTEQALPQLPVTPQAPPLLAIATPAAVAPAKLSPRSALSSSSDHISVKKKGETADLSAAERCQCSCPRMCRWAWLLGRSPLSCNFLDQLYLPARLLA